MQLKCVNCGATIPAKQINVQKLMAVCQHCDAVFSIEDMAGTTALHESSVKQKRRKTSQPDKVNVREENGNLSIDYHVRDKLGWLEIVFGIILLVIGVPLGILSLSLFTAANFLASFIVFLLAIVCFFFLSSLFVNTLEVTADDNHFTYKESPIYVFAHKQIERADVVGFRTEQANLANNSHDDYYNIYAQLVDGDEVPFIQYLQRPVAYFIHQMLEDYVISPDQQENPFLDDISIPDEITRNHLNDEGEIQLDDAISLEDLLQQKPKNF
jgi:hypothetical protein